MIFVHRLYITVVYNILHIKSLVGTPEFVAPEVVNYDFISTGTGETGILLSAAS